MKREDKELLLKDLCSRLPYGVKVRRYVYTTPTDAIESVVVFHTSWLRELYAEEAEFKPYLRPRSSMTKEEKDEYELFFSYGEHGWDEYTIEDEVPKIIDWLNAHHFDYRGLIEKGLALEAPVGMYN